jgi:hypothetical protein
MATKSITKATPAQWAQIDELRERVISGITNQPDDEAVRGVVRSMWARMGKKPSAVLVADCPIVGAIFCAACLGIAGDSQLRSQLRSQLDSQLYVSIWWRAWSGWYEGGKILGVQFDESVFSAFREWTTHVPLIYANEAIPVVSRFPKTVKWDNSRLHCEDGKAVEFASGWGLWAIGGVAVDEQIVMRPETQTLKQIESETSEEVRRIRIERFGWMRYLKESGAKCVKDRFNERDNQREGLFVLGDGRKRFVVSDPSTGRRYALGVPREVTDCESAQNFLSHGLDKFATVRT